MAKIIEIQNSPGRFLFDCPGCKCSHELPAQIGRHTPLKWGWNGSFDKPSFTPSILVNKLRANPMDHVCHSYVTDGKIQYLDDCTHELAGQTIELPEQ